LTSAGSCTVHTGGAGSLGDDAGDEAASSCSTGAGASQCDQCVDANCCSFLSACVAQTDCQNLPNCIDGCIDDVPCQNACMSMYADALALYDDLGSCVTVKCPICSASGIGDPCSARYACESNLTCNGSYCTIPCSASSDCTGIGPGGGNMQGTANVCVYVAGAGNTCVPTCGNNGNCTGLYCKLTTAIEGTQVQVCSSFPDGG
jgi:hypothetical protein